MKTTSAALALAALVLAFPAASRDVPGSPAAVFLIASQLEQVKANSDIAVIAATVGSGQLVLDVIDGKAPAALVALTLPEAMAAAREAAWQEGRMLVIPAGLQFHEVARYERDARPVGFVTVGAPSAQLEKVMGYLHSKQALYGR